MIKKIATLFIVLAMVAIGGFFYVTNQINSYLDQPVKITEPEIITISSGTSLNGVLNQLAQNEWIETSEYSRLLRRVHPELVHIKAGTFQIEPQQTLEQALLFLNEGREHQFAITFVEGSRFSEWIEALSQAPYLEHELKGLSEEQVAVELGIEQSKLEGLFLAETYHYTVGTSDADILKRAHQKLNDVLDSKWQEKQANLPLKTPYEALILASIIEKETAVESERERVASVFVNRLNKRMRLQTDPTVIYGMGDNYDGNIRKKDLRTPTPYNTYVINGLPPTPIAMPGRASIEAALNPEDSNYLYFVASGKGGHVFSKNLADHNRAVRAYLKQLRSNK
ncbi:endolytic transglycosylase MltG [Vibrio paucivorans]